MSSRTVAPVASAVTFFLALTAGSAAHGKPGLQELLTAEVASFPAPSKVGVYVRHLATGQEAAVRGDERWNGMSVIKIAILARAYQLVEAGTLNLDERVEIALPDLRGGTGMLKYFDVPIRVTVRDLLTQMIISSDNTATDLVLARVGGVAAMNRWLSTNGYPATRINSTLLDYFRRPLELLGAKYRQLLPEEVFVLRGAPSRPTYDALRARLLPGIEVDRAARKKATRAIVPAADDPSYWLSSMTPRDAGRLLADLQRGAGVASATAGREMIELLKRQQFGARRLPHYLTVPIAHKTGDNQDEGIANDAGIVYGASGPVVIVVFTTGATTAYGEMEDAIGRLARAVVAHFE